MNLQHAMLIFTITLSCSVYGEEWTSPELTLTDEGFEVIGHEQDITIYQDKKTRNIRVAAEGLIAAPPDVVHKALLDYEKQKGVIKRVSEVSVLRRGAHYLIVYQHLNLPVISDRDYTLSVSWGIAGQTRWVMYRAVTDKGPPEKDGVVRVTDHEGSWQLSPTGAGGGMTKVRFQMSIDLAGWLPRWLARSKAGDEIPDLFASIRTLALTEDKAPKGDQS